MYRAIPVMNKACTERVQKREYEAHKARIKKMRPQLDNTQPETFTLDHIRNNLKREQMMEDRYHEIDRDNRILLQKMSDIMKKEQHPVSTHPPQSMGKDARKRDLMRITTENNAILNRIQRVQPVCSTVEWADSYRKSCYYVRNRCEYPPPLMKKSRSASSMTPLGGSNMSRSKGMASTGSLAPSRPVGVDGGATPCTGIATERPGQGNPDDLSYVMKAGKNIAGKFYLVEMSTDGRILTISAYDGDAQKTMELIVNEKNHRKIFRECNGDYGLIGERLRIVLAGEKMKEKLALDFPNGGLEHALGPPVTMNGPDAIQESTVNWKLPGADATSADKK